MKKYIIIILIQGLFFNAFSQTDNQVQGEGSGEHITTSDELVIYGDSAGVMIDKSTSNGYSNSFMGYYSGYSLTTGDRNVFLGFEAGYSNTTGEDNVVVGTYSGKYLTEDDNILIGYRAGEDLITGNKNIMLGYYTGNGTTDDVENNIFIGNYAGGAQSGEHNIFIGRYAGTGFTGTGSSNVGIGGGDYVSDSWRNLSIVNAIGAPLYGMTSGSNNVAFGNAAGGDIETGCRNTAVGTSAGGHTEVGVSNTFIGIGAGGDNNRPGDANKGNYNTLVGFLAGMYNREGNYLTGMGYDGYLVQDDKSYNIFFGASPTIRGKESIAIGYSTYVYDDYGVAVGYDTYSKNHGAFGMGYKTNVSNGDYALAMGSEVDLDNAYTIGIGKQVNIDNVDGIAIGGNSSVTGDYSVAYGTNASVSGANSVALGNSVSVATDNTITIGNASVTSIKGAVNWTTLSDGRYKTDVQENVSGLDFITQLRPVSYYLNSQKSENAPRYVGFIAQEVEATANAIGYDFSGIKTPQNETDIYGLRYAAFSVPLVKAVQELDKTYQENEQAIQENDVIIAKYDNAIELLKAKIERLEEQNNVVLLGKSEENSVARRATW